MNAPNPFDRRVFLRASGVIALTTGTASLLSACTDSSNSPSSSDSSGAPKRGGELILATADTPINLDPQDLANYASMQVYGNVFSRLVTMDDKYEIHPSLAKSWKQDDEVTWTVDLVDNAVFHSGDPVTADDVKFSFERIKDHNNAVYLSAFKSTEVLSPTQVRFHLTGPLGPFLQTLAGFSDIVSEKAVTSKDPKLEPVGCGPYKFVEWRQNDHIALERWDKYFGDDLPYLDKLTFRAIGDDSIRLTALQSGDVNWIQRVPAQQTETLSSSDALKRSEPKPYLPDLIALNVTKPPFDDKRVRQAIAWCIDRAEIAKLVFFSDATPLTEAAPPDSPFHSGVDPYAGGPDPEKAKALLKEAGVEDLHVAYDGQSDLPAQIKIGEVLKSQLAKAGITLEITNYTAADWIDRLLGKKYDMTETYFALNIDPAWIYYPLCLSTSGQNFTGFGTPEGDELLKPLMFNTDEEARKEAYAAVAAYIADESPIIFLFSELQQYWMQPGVSGPFPVPTLQIDCSNVSLS